MITHHEETICRRQDGSIDTDLYVRRAAALRGAAKPELFARLAGSVARCMAGLAERAGGTICGRRASKASIGRTILIKDASAAG